MEKIKKGMLLNVIIFAALIGGVVGIFLQGDSLRCVIPYIRDNPRRTSPINETVINKAFTAGTGIFSSNKWTLIVEEDGVIGTFSVSPEFYIDIQIGDRVHAVGEYTVYSESGKCWSNWKSWLEKVDD